MFSFNFKTLFFNVGIESVRIRHEIKSNRKTGETVLFFVFDFILNTFISKTTKDRSRPVLEDNNTIPQTKTPLIIKYPILWRSLLLEISILNITAVR
tara:strand:+ start:65 stop:355 length:291 start_codon:yes stop_codon:yes gene_type:complete